MAATTPTSPELHCGLTAATIQYTITAHSTDPPYFTTANGSPIGTWRNTNPSNIVTTISNRQTIRLRDDPTLFINASPPSPILTLHPLL